MAFPPEFIDRVRDASDIVEVIGQYVNLKKRGANYVGLCPFHNEKAPSFSVSHVKGFFKCFGCGAGGNVFSFIMQKENMTFPEAVEYLARRANMQIPRTETREQASAREKLFEAVAAGQRFFREQFQKSNIPKEYLKSRNFGREIAEKMELGFAPEGWDNFARTLKSDQKNYVTVGLLRARDKGEGYYDYFRHRLIFPIKDLSGRVCAFGGRYLKEEDEGNPKYLNSPESPVYSKGSLLYAIGQNRAAIRDAGFVYLVEGYTDLLRLLSCKIENCAAGSGTAFTFGQARLLRRYTERAVLLYDGDEAGCVAAVKTGRLLAAAGLEAEVIAMPPEHDPDSFLLEFGAEELEKAPKLSLLKFQYRLHQASTETRQGKEKLAKEMLESAVVLPDEIKRSLALQEISNLLELPVEALRSVLRTVARHYRAEEEEITEQKSLYFAPHELPERDLIRLLICSPRAGENIFTSLEKNLISNGDLRSVFDTLKSLWLKGDLQDAENLVNQFDNPAVKNFISDCALWEIPGDAEKLITDAVKKLRLNALKDIKARLDEKIKLAQSGGEDVIEIMKMKMRILEAEKKQQDLDKLIAEFAEQLISKGT